MIKKNLINIGKKSKKAFSSPISTKKKNKVLNDYCILIKKSRKKIITQNKKDIYNIISGCPTKQGGPHTYTIQQYFMYTSQVNAINIIK